MRIAYVHDCGHVHDSGKAGLDGLSPAGRTEVERWASNGDYVVLIEANHDGDLPAQAETGALESVYRRVRLLPERPEHRYFTGLHRDSDRLLDTILAVHRREPLDVVLLRVDPSFALGLIRAQRLLGELQGVELRLACPESDGSASDGSASDGSASDGSASDGCESGGSESNGSGLDGVVRRFMRSQVLQHCDQNGTAMTRRRPELPAGRKESPGPTISIIIPVFNVTEYLDEALSSARRGHRVPIELIVVDDGSDPVAAQIISRTAGVKLVRQENRGLAAARNTGLRHAVGEYILPLDADDLLEPRFIPAALAALRANDDLAYISSYVRYFGAITSCLPPLGYVPDLSIVLNTFARATALFRRDALAACGGYDEAMTSGEDWDLYLRLNAAGLRGDVLPIEGVRYRRHAESMTFTMDDDERRRTLARIVRTHGRALSAQRLGDLLAVLADLWTTGYQPSASREYLSRKTVSAMTHP